MALSKTVDIAAILPQDPAKRSELMITLAQGDYSKLNVEQKAVALQIRCARLGLDPWTAPFIFLATDGKVSMYPKAECADQLAATHNLSTKVVRREERNGCYIVEAAVYSRDGRYTTAEGVVPITVASGQPISPAAYANARKKCETQARRRAIFKHTGLTAETPEFDADATPEGTYQRDANPREKFFGLLHSQGWAENDDASRERRRQYYCHVLGRDDIADGSQLDQRDWQVMLQHLEGVLTGAIQVPDCLKADADGVVAEGAVVEGQVAEPTPEPPAETASPEAETKITATQIKIIRTRLTELGIEPTDEACAKAIADRATVDELPLGEYSREVAAKAVYKLGKEVAK